MKTKKIKTDYSEDVSLANGQWVRWQMWSVESASPDTGRQVVWQTKNNMGTVQYRNNKEATWTTLYLNRNDRISVNGYVRGIA